METNMTQVVGYEISAEEIERVAREQEQERQTASRAKSQTCGRFTFDATTGQVSGPAGYMNERYAARMAAINAGRDMVANMGMQMHGDSVKAVLVSLQTDYAAWAGMQSFLR